MHGLWFASMLARRFLPWREMWEKIPLDCERYCSPPNLPLIKNDIHIWSFQSKKIVKGRLLYLQWLLLYLRSSSAGCPWRYGEWQTANSDAVYSVQGGELGSSFIPHHKVKLTTATRHMSSSNEDGDALKTYFHATKLYPNCVVCQRNFVLPALESFLRKLMESSVKCLHLVF